MDSIRFFPGKFRFFRCPRGADGQEGKNRVAANGMSAATRHVRGFLLCRRSGDGGGFRGGFGCGFLRNGAFGELFRMAGQVLIVGVPVGLLLL